MNKIILCAAGARTVGSASNWSRPRPRRMKRIVKSFTFLRFSSRFHRLSENDIVGRPDEKSTFFENLDRANGDDFRSKSHILIHKSTPKWHFGVDLCIRMCDCDRKSSPLARSRFSKMSISRPGEVSKKSQKIADQLSEQAFPASDADLKSTSDRPQIDLRPTYKSGGAFRKRV